ncbi:MAG TPA: type II toxin-antitoxin system RelE/ParE family toxin [Candidatus Saccharimonadia bacterium]|nr:type II toxin-antitoxin system RelE/ParE family toxin [Candidatus Saccharimonadia bacterium]
MKFEVKFYEALGGKIPAEEFLNEIWESQPKLAKHTMSNLKKLEDSERHGPPVTKHLGDNLFEVRTGSINIARIFFSYGADQTIVLLSGFVKKSSSTPQKYLDIAYKLRDEFEQRSDQ